MHDTGMSGQSSEPPSRLPLSIAPLCVVLPLCACACVFFSSLQVCVPRGDGEPWRQRVCSKGCNQLIKVDKTGKLGATHGSDNSQTDGFELVVCQADKRIVCEGTDNARALCGTCMGPLGAAWVTPPWQVTKADTIFLEKRLLQARTLGAALKKKRSRLHA